MAMASNSSRAKNILARHTVNSIRHVCLHCRLYRSVMENCMVDLSSHSVLHLHPLLLGLTNSPLFPLDLCSQVNIPISMGLIHCLCHILANSKKGNIYTSFKGFHFTGLWYVLCTAFHLICLFYGNQSTW